MKNGKGVLKHGDEGGAKAGKGQTVFVGKSARRVLWRYLIARDDRNDPDARLFSTRMSVFLTLNACVI